MNSEEIEDRDELESEKEQPPWRFTIYHALGLILFYAVIQVWIAFAISKSETIDFKNLSWQHVAWLNGLSGVMTLLTGSMLAGFSLWEMLLQKRFHPLAAFFGGLSVIGLGILASDFLNLLQWLHPLDGDPGASINMLKENIFGILFAACVVAPVTEELIFRGIILEGLRQTYSATVALFVPAALFSLVHLQYSYWFAAVFFLGLFLGWLKLRTGSVLLCMILHAVFNLTPFVVTDYLHLEIQGYNVVSNPNQVSSQPLWFDAVGLALFAAGFVGLLYLTKPQQPSPEVAV